MKKLFTMLLALLLLLGLVGCSGAKEEEADETADDAKTVTVVTTSDVVSMDTVVATDGGSFIAQNMFMAGLMELDENGKAIPDLAESYTVSDDGLVYTFKIREDTYWSNGDPVTAADFIYGWSRLVDPDIASEYNWLLETANVVNGNCYDTESGLTAEDLGVKAIDDKTLEVTLTKPTDYFLSLLAFPSLFPANQAFVESCGDQYSLSVENLLSCGPYKLTSWTADYSYEFELTDSYWGYDEYVAAGNAEKVVFRVIADTQTALLEYENDNLQTVILSGEQVSANKDAEGYIDRLTGYLFYLLLNINNNESNTDLQNENVRKALSYALDRETIATALNDGSIAAEGIIPRDLAKNPETNADFRDDSGVLVSYDLEAAKQYYQAAVEELGHDITLEMLYDTDQGDNPIKAAEQIQSYLEAVGFTINLNGKPKKERLSLQREHTFDISLTRWGPDYGDPQTYMDLFVTTNTSNNQGGYASEAYDEHVATAESGIASIDRWNEFIAAEKVLVQEDYGIVPVYQLGGAMLISPSISGIEFHSAGVDNYRHIIINE